MGRRLLLVLSLASGLSGMAQFDIGASVGGYGGDLWWVDGNRGRSYASFEPGPGLPWVVAIHYREQGPATIRFATEVMIQHRSFRVTQSYGGLGYGENEVWGVRLLQLYWGVLPEMSLGRKGRSVLRFGPQFGWALDGTKQGTSNSWSQGSSGTLPTNTTLEVGPIDAKEYGGDIRLHLGLGFRFPLRPEGSVIVVDPYANFALTSIQNERGPIPTRGLDVGLRVGIAWNRLGRGLWPALRSGAPSRE